MGIGEYGGGALEDSRGGRGGGRCFSDDVIVGGVIATCKITTVDVVSLELSKPLTFDSRRGVMWGSAATAQPRQSRHNTTYHLEAIAMHSLFSCVAPRTKGEQLTLNLYHDSGENIAMFMQLQSRRYMPSCRTLKLYCMTLLC